MENKNTTYIFSKTRMYIAKHFEKDTKNSRIHRRNRGEGRRKLRRQILVAESEKLLIKISF